VEFKLSDDAIMIRNVASEYLKEKCTGAFLREMARDDRGFSRTMWREIAELGWLGILYDEEYGGSAAGFLDMFVIFEEMGKVLFPSPLFCSAILSGLIISEAGSESCRSVHLPAIIRGDEIFTTALLDERGKIDCDDPILAATESSKGVYAMQGTRLLVPYAHVADRMIVCAKAAGAAGEGSTLFQVEKGAGQEIVPLETMSGGKTFALVFEGTEVHSDSIIGTVGQGAVYIHRILPKVIALKCAEMLGGLQRVVAMTVGYVKERRQFGAPLGSLQAVQHHCADMATYLETTRLIAYQAASLISEGLPCEKEVAMAKAWCSDAYKQATWIGHQLHGGIGFTEEYDLHFFYKHAKESELAFGDARSHRAAVADFMGI